VQSLVGAIFYQATQLLFIGVLLGAFGAIGGWSASEILLLVGLRMASHAVYAFFGRRIIDNDLVVQTGEFDRYLLRPAPAFLQLLTRMFNLQQFGDVILGVVALSITAAHAPVDWTPARVGYLVAAVFGGGLAEAGLQTVRAALAFRLRDTQTLTGLIETIFGTYGNFPLHMFGTAGAVFFTVVFPAAFIAWAPATVLLGRTDEVWFGGTLAALSPVIGALIMVLAVVFYNRQARHYSSPGN